MTGLHHQYFTDTHLGTDGILEQIEEIAVCVQWRRKLEETFLNFFEKNIILFQDWLHFRYL